MSSVPGRAVPLQVGEVLRSPGRPLEGGLARDMGSRFGHDFGNVRVHADARAGESATAMDAAAYAVGRDLVFGHDRFAPHTVAGRRLLAHELAHVVQQGGRVARKPTGIAPEGGSLEREAERAADAIAGGARRVQVGSGSPPEIARQPNRGVDSAGGEDTWIEISCELGIISFHTPDGVSSYILTTCDLPDGEYRVPVSAQGGTVFLDFSDALDGGDHGFGYSVDDTQVNPASLVEGQQTVRVVVGSSTAVHPGGQSGLRVLGELPLDFEAVPLDPDPDSIPPYFLTNIGLAMHVLASGDLSWLSQGDAAQRVLSPQYWSPLLPHRGFMTLDRLLGELPRDLAPKIEAELDSGRRLTWIQWGFTDAELRSIPSLVERLNAGGIASLSSAELSVLERAAERHIAASSPGAPFASHTRPNFGGLDWARDKKYRVRVEVPSSSVLDVSGSNAFTDSRRHALNNLDEAEFMVTRSEGGRLVSVERMSGSPEPGLLLKYSDAIRWGGRVVFVVGTGASVHRVATAPAEERPTVIAEEAGGMAGGAAGTAAAVAGCLLFGVTTGGVGLFVCGLAGGIAGGIAGSAAGGAMVTGLDEAAGRNDCPSCHQQQREWTATREASEIESMSRAGDLSGGPVTALPGPGGFDALSPGELQNLLDWFEEAEE